MRKRVLFAAVAGIAVLVVSVGLLRGEGDDLRVDAIEVGTGSVETNLALTGTVINDYTVSLTALLDGEITLIEAREGDRVEAGTVLARLDDGPPRAQLDKAMAAVVLSRQELSLAERRVERMTNLASAGSESSIALEDAELARQRAEAAEKSAQADQLLAELALRNASVRAPYAGVVIEQDVEQGQWVEAGTQLFTLVAEAGRAIEAEVDAGDIARVAVGQPVSLALAETPESSLPSVIERIAESVLGIAIGIAAVMIVRTISRGGNNLVFSELETFGLNSVWVYSGLGERLTARATTRWKRHRQSRCGGTRCGGG